MTYSKAICAVVLILILAGPSWAQDKTRKAPPNKPNVQKQAAQKATGKKRQPAADEKKTDKPVGDKMARGNPFTGALENLDLSDDQDAEIRAIMKEHKSAHRTQMENQKGNNQGQNNKSNQGTADMKQKREAVLAKFQSQGLKGKELKQAVQQSLGIKDRPQPGDRPRDQVVQDRAELVKKIREVLTEKQQQMFDVSLRKNTEQQKADRPKGPTTTDKRKRPDKPLGKDGR
jgi:hypothetical protein